MAFTKNKMDLTEGSVLKKMLIFAIPIVLTNILQQLYHAADMIVVGNFAQDSTASLAAVGSTNSITALCLNLFVGLAVGANVVCAKLYGAKKEEELRRAMHTSILLAALCGVGIGLFGVLMSRTLLIWISVPESVLAEATLYMQIIFLGQPGSIVYNFGASILRSHGDTKRPMYILMTTGLVNVILNLIFVVVFHLDAAGVALATVSANYLSAAAVLWILFHPNGDFRLSVSELRLSRQVRPIASVGIPSGLNSMLFSVSNVIIVAALNTLGETVLAANSAAHNVDAMLYQIILAVSSACVSFVGQNVGAGRMDRVDSLWRTAMTISIGFFAVLSLILYPFAETIVRLFTSDPDVIAYAALRVRIICCSYPIYVIPEICIGCIRGMGKSAVTSALNVIGICTPRILWVACVFSALKTGVAMHDYNVLLWCYPISWGISGAFQLLCYRYYRKRLACECE